MKVNSCSHSRLSVQNQNGAAWSETLVLLCAISIHKVTSWSKMAAQVQPSRLYSSQQRREERKGIGIVLFFFYKIAFI